MFFLLETIRDRVGDIKEKYDNELNILRRKFELVQQENYELKSKVADEKYKRIFFFNMKYILYFIEIVY
jgi:hypothetical protein